MLIIMVNVKMEEHAQLIIHVSILTGSIVSFQKVIRVVLMTIMETKKREYVKRFVMIVHVLPAGNQSAHVTAKYIAMIVMQVSGERM